jgi:hypothetical protein
MLPVTTKKHGPIRRSEDFDNLKWIQNTKEWGAVCDGSFLFTPLIFTEEGIYEITKSQS